MDADRVVVHTREGESGELGDGEADLDVTRRNAAPLEGDRERERRSCLNAAALSMWRMWLGDGKWSVPPVSPCGEYVGSIGISEGDHA